MIRLGTSGFSYDDWVGPFYPTDLPRSQWLSFYAHEFDTVELNVTYYRPPSQRTVAGPLGYVRFHGRNAKDWWEHEHGWQRYDYTYSEGELREWVPKLRQLDSELPITLVYANNQYRGQSVDALRALRGLLAEEA